MSKSNNPGKRVINRNPLTSLTGCILRMTETSVTSINRIMYISSCLYSIFNLEIALPHCFNLKGDLIDKTINDEI